MSKIHSIETKKIRSTDVKLIFFNKQYEEQFDKSYIKLVHDSKIISKENYQTRWFLKDKLGFKYKLINSALIFNSDKSSAKINPNKTIMFTSIFKLFLENNKLPPDTKNSDNLIIEYFNKSPIYSKIINNKIIIWDTTKILSNIFSSVLIIDNIIVGMVTCELLTENDAIEYMKDGDILYKDMRLYISRVDIRPDFQGMGLCKPLLSYMIKNLRRLGYEMLFIENASLTKDGVPACICYYKAGIDNNYKMRYTRENKVKTMNINNCFDKPTPTSYFYMSDNIVKRGTKKLKKHFRLSKK